MRLDPVFLVAPEPEGPAPSTVSRRMFVGALASSFGLGALLGYTATGREGEASPPPREPSTELRWALQLQEGPLEELVAGHRSFLIVFADTEDPRLLAGIERLALAVLEADPSVRDPRPDLASALASEIASRPVARPLAHHVDALRRIR
jgi:hypothetical protein